MVKRVHMHFSDACPQPYADRIDRLEARQVELLRHLKMAQAGLDAAIAIAQEADT
jgi:hypothetical protein